MEIQDATNNTVMGFNEHVAGSMTKLHPKFDGLSGNYNDKPDVDTINF